MFAWRLHATFGCTRLPRLPRLHTRTRCHILHGLVIFCLLYAFGFPLQLRGYLHYATTPAVGSLVTVTHTATRVGSLRLCRLFCLCGYYGLRSAVTTILHYDTIPHRAPGWFGYTRYSSAFYRALDYRLYIHSVTVSVTVRLVAFVHTPRYALLPRTVTAALGYSPFTTPHTVLVLYWFCTVLPTGYHYAACGYVCYGWLRTPTQLPPLRSCVGCWLQFTVTRYRCYLPVLQIPHYSGFGFARSFCHHRSSLVRLPLTTLVLPAVTCPYLPVTYHTHAGWFYSSGFGYSPPVQFLQFSYSGSTVLFYSSCCGSHIYALLHGYAHVTFTFPALRLVRLVTFAGLHGSVAFAVTVSSRIYVLPVTVTVVHLRVCSLRYAPLCPVTVTFAARTFTVRLPVSGWLHTFTLLILQFTYTRYRVYVTRLRFCVALPVRLRLHTTHTRYTRLVTRFTFDFNAAVAPALRTGLVALPLHVLRLRLRSGYGCGYSDYLLRVVILRFWLLFCGSAVDWVRYTLRYGSPVTTVPLPVLVADTAGWLHHFAVLDTTVLRLVACIACGYVLTDYYPIRGYTLRHVWFTCRLPARPYARFTVPLPYRFVPRLFCTRSVACVPARFTGYLRLYTGSACLYIATYRTVADFMRLLPLPHATCLYTVTFGCGCTLRLVGSVYSSYYSCVAVVYLQLQLRLHLRFPVTLPFTVYAGYITGSLRLPHGCVYALPAAPRTRLHFGLRLRTTGYLAACVTDYLPGSILPVLVRSAFPVTHTGLHTLPVCPYWTVALDFGLRDTVGYGWLQLVAAHAPAVHAHVHYTLRLRIPVAACYRTVLVTGLRCGYAVPVYTATCAHITYTVPVTRLRTARLPLRLHILPAHRLHSSTVTATVLTFTTHITTPRYTLLRLLVTLLPHTVGSGYGLVTPRSAPCAHAQHGWVRSTRSPDPSYCYAVHRVLHAHLRAGCVGLLRLHGYTPHTAVPLRTHTQRYTVCGCCCDTLLWLCRLPRHTAHTRTVTLPAVTHTATLPHSRFGSPRDSCHRDTLYLYIPLWLRLRYHCSLGSAV